MTSIRGAHVAMSRMMVTGHDLMCIMCTGLSWQVDVLMDIEILSTVSEGIHAVGKEPFEIPQILAYVVTYC